MINACTSADGGVYEFTPCFELIYCAISREYVPDGEWTPEDMLRLYEETGLPVFDPNMSREMFLEYYLAFNGGGCIDGGTRFDSAQFAALLEYASALPERFEPDMSVDMARICAGRQLCAREEMTSSLVLTDENGAERVLELKGRTPGAAEVEAALALINSASAVYDCDETLLDIVIDEAGAYFAGDKSAEDACAIIQNRVDTYIAEQFG